MACVAGGLAYWLCLRAKMEAFGAQVVGGIVVFLVRIMAVQYHLTLPILKGDPEIETGEKE